LYSNNVHSVQRAIGKPTACTYQACRVHTYDIPSYMFGCQRPSSGSNNWDIRCLFS